MRSTRLRWEVLTTMELPREKVSGEETLANMSISEIQKTCLFLKKKQKEDIICNWDVNTVSSPRRVAARWRYTLPRKVRRQSAAAAVTFMSMSGNIAIPPPPPLSVLESGAG